MSPRERAPAEELGRAGCEGRLQNVSSWASGRPVHHPWPPGPAACSAARWPAPLSSLGWGHDQFGTAVYNKTRECLSLKVGL